MEVKDFDIELLCEILRDEANDVLDEMHAAVSVEMLDKQWAVFREIVKIVTHIEESYDRDSELGFGIRILNRDAEVWATNNYNRRLKQLQEGDK